MNISLKNRLYLFLFPLILFVLVGCCDDHFKIDRNVRIIDQGVNAEYRYKVFLNSIRCGSSRHGISFSTYEYKTRDSIEFNQRIGNFDPDNFKLTRFAVSKVEGISPASVLPKNALKGSIQIEKDFLRVNIQFDQSILYGDSLAPPQYRPYEYNGVYTIKSTIKSAVNEK